MVWGWNRGLTKETDSRVAKNGAKISAALTGTHLSAETKAKISATLKGNANVIEAKRNSSQYKTPVNVRKMRTIVYATLHNLPQICCFCGKEITQFGKGSE